MYWDRFDICEAYYLYHMLYHQGQWSKEYALSGVFSRLCFSPRMSLAGPEDLEDNARAIYDSLVSGATEVRDRRN